MTATDPLLAMVSRNSSDVSFVRNHILAVHSIYELVRLGDVMVLSRCEGEPQWVAQPVHTHVNLRAESTLASASA